MSESEESSGFVRYFTWQAYNDNQLVALDDPITLVKCFLIDIYFDKVFCHSRRFQLKLIDVQSNTSIGILLINLNSRQPYTPKRLQKSHILREAEFFHKMQSIVRGKQIFELFNCVPWYLKIKDILHLRKLHKKCDALTQPTQTR